MFVRAGDGDGLRKGKLSGGKCRNFTKQPQSCMHHITLGFEYARWMRGGARTAVLGVRLTSSAVVAQHLRFKCHHKTNERMYAFVQKKRIGVRSKQQ